MVSYEVEIKGLDEQIRRLDRYPQIAGVELGIAMRQAVAMIEREAKIAAPVNTGQLRSSITSKIELMMGGEVTGIVGTNVIYAPAVEFGARPHFPPLQPLAYWVSRKLGIQGWEGIGVTIMIARKIAARGTRAQPFLKPAFEKAKNDINKAFANAVERIVQKLAGDR